MWLLDTNIIIKLPKHMREKFPKNQIKCSFITVLEHPISNKYDKMDVIYPDEQIWAQSLKLAILLRNLGQVIPIADLIIGTTAITYQLTLVSNDRHFDYIKQINSSLTTISQQKFEEIIENSFRSIGDT
ncbi:MAG: type II toxin-antitoxin system VapC family toxin [Promethearchaeota archaeon]